MMEQNEVSAAQVEGQNQTFKICDDVIKNLKKCQGFINVTDKYRSYLVDISDQPIRGAVAQFEPCSATNTWLS